MNRMCELKGPKCSAVAVFWNAGKHAGWYCPTCYERIQKRRMGNQWKRRERCS